MSTSLKEVKEVRDCERATMLTRAYEAGNFVNSYETQDLDAALELRCKYHEPDYQAAFIVGFYASYERHEIPLFYQENFTLAYEDVGEELIALGLEDQPEVGFAPKPRFSITVKEPV